MTRTIRASKRVLLTGATGFIGREIHRALLDQGHDVRVVVRTGSVHRLIKDASLGHVETPDMFAEPRDFWADPLRDIDCVVNAAWSVDPRTYLASARNAECVVGSLTLALASLDASVKHFVGIGTCFEYKLPSERITVDSPLEPTSLYATSKVALFRILTGLFASASTDFSWARLFYLHGPNEHADRLVPYLRTHLARGEMTKLSSGTQVRDFLDTPTAGVMIARIVSSGQLGAINICSGEPITVRQLAERIADEYGRRDLLQFGTAPLRPTDPSTVVGVCNLDLPHGSFGGKQE